MARYVLTYEKKAGTEQAFAELPWGQRYLQVAQAEEILETLENLLPLVFFGTDCDGNLEADDDWSSDVEYIPPQDGTLGKLIIDSIWLDYEEKTKKILLWIGKQIAETYPYLSNMVVFTLKLETV
jgi:hypothetical protein